MEEKESKKKRNGHTNRILLKPEVLSRLDGWIDEVRKTFKGLKITRADIVNHLLLIRPVTLSKEEVQQIGGLNFDEVRFAAWALQELREARARNEGTTLRDLLERFGSLRHGSDAS